MKNRSYNSIKNTSFALSEQIIDSILGFIVRSVFINTLGQTYLGLNGLFSDILSMLSLAELGFGTAILYTMYKPAAENDEKKLAALLNLYRKIYRTVGIGIIILGICMTPILSYFISDIPDISGLTLIYWLYLANTAISYFFSYKKSILVANQRTYVASAIQITFKLIQYILQIIVLVVFKQFIIYLIVQIICTVLNNIMLSIFVDQHYKYLKIYSKEKLDEQTVKGILKNVKAMFVSKISSVIVTSTDNLLISKFVSTVTLGYYSNYTMFVNLIKTAFVKIFEAITGSIGNLVAVETSEKSRITFRNIWFVNFWMIGFSSITLFVLINPFIKLWVGETYILPISTVFLICLNMYMRLIRNTQLAFIDTYGLFVNVTWKSIAEALINIVASLFFLKVMNFGVFGVLLGTFISNITTNFWFEPYVIYTKKFHYPLHEYFSKFFAYLIVTLITGLGVYYICYYFNFENSILKFFSDFLICCFVINIVFSIVFHRTEEFKYFSIKMKELKDKLFKKKIKFKN